MKLQYIETTYTNNVKETTEQEIIFVNNKEVENELVNLYPQVQYQQIEGFGGTITESAGYIYSLMEAEQKEEIIRKYFEKSGMNYRYVRIPIDSCDFSLGHYEAVSCEEDELFERFSFERVEKYILPLLDDAEKSSGRKLEIMLSPWSPPSYMKTNGKRNHGGKLKNNYKKRWSEYICKYIEEYRKRGYRVTKISLQNEPKAVQTWDSCIFTAEEQKEFLKNYMWPSLVKHHLEDVEVYIWDHNKERAFEWAETIIDNETQKMVAGVAFHWYSGDHFQALQMIKERFPQKKLLLSEACIEYRKFDACNYLDNAQKYAHDMIGNFNNGMNTFLDWNLILDEQGGPNHAGNFCDAPFHFDRKKKQIKESNIFGYIWHFSHFLEPNSVRIGVSTYTDKLEIAAFQSKSKIVFMVLNRTNERISAVIRLRENCAKIVVSPKAIATGIISENVKQKEFHS